jgi:hypothetical protein
MSAPLAPNQSDPKPSNLSLPAAKIVSRAGKLGRLNGRTLRYSLLLGSLTGLAFSSALWAYQTVLLMQAHVAFPWIVFLVGAILCVGVCALAALLTWLLNRALLGILFWVLAALSIAELAIYLPLKIAPRLMIFLEPGLQSRLPAYPINATFRAWGGIGTIGLAIFMGILGLLQLTLVDQAVPATTPAGRLVPYFVFIPVILLTTAMISDMVSQQLRAPLVATNDLIQFAIDHQNTPPDPVLARQVHLSTIEPISNLIDRPRRLFLGQYDETFSQVDVLIDFGGEWADCNTVSDQPVFCKVIPNP